MGSLGFPRETRLETTTRFKGPLPLVRSRLTAVHQYGSGTPFQPIETKFGPGRAGTHWNSRKIKFAANLGAIGENLCSKLVGTKDIMAALRPFRRQAGASGIP
jgi:hypothetical protein